MFNLNAKINNKKILIYGFGKSGQSSYNYLKKLNKVSIFDDYKKAYSKAIDIINIIKRKATIAIKNVITSVNSFYDSNLNGFEEEIKLFVECSSTKDFKEGVKAFIEKRCPDFKGE